jgi:RNA polymerase sigma factor (sigma-70 family)
MVIAPRMPANESEGLPGDPRTQWAARIARHERALLIALLARGIPLDRAQDLAQMAWTRLWEQQLAGGLAFVELPGLAIRQALLLEADARRLQRRQHGLRVLERAPAPLDPDEQILSRDQLRRVAAELDRVAPSARKVFELAHGGEGLSHGEIALRIGLSVERVRHVLCELRERLRPLIEEEDRS